MFGRTVRHVSDRPYTLLSCGMSIDGYLDDADATRLHLSNAADFDRVDAERARCDAILVGAATALVLAGGVALALLRSRPRPGSAVLDTERRSAGILAAAPTVVLASLGTTAGHTAAFLLAASAVGVRAAPTVLLPLALLVLVAMALPLSVAGWGVREGAAAWLFGAAGLGAEVGVAVATAYGTMALVAVLPGGALLLLDRLRHGAGREAG